MKGRKSIAFIMLLLMAGALSACRIDLFEKLKSGGGATVTPLNSQWIASTGVNADIVIKFDSSMDTGSTPTTITGDTLGALSSYAWSNGDTLTVTPSGTWPTGNNIVLNISCLTTEGVAIELDYSFNVAGSLRYASTLGSSTGAGTRVDPIDTVNGAINSITGTSGPYPGVILVAAGDYTNAGPVINLDFEISIYGGWATDWSEEDPTRYISKLTNSMTGTTNSVIEIYSGVSNAQVLSGFTVSITPSATVASATYNGILIDTAPLTIRNMVITSTDITDATDITTQGIHVSNGSGSSIFDCTIALGAYNKGTVGSSGCTNNGIYITGSSPTIYNMIISTADSTDGTSLTSRGLYFYNSGNGKIYDSTITMGSHTDSSGTSTACKNKGIKIDNSSSPEINGMSIHAGTSIMSDATGITYGIMISGDSNPSIHDNPEINGGQASGKTYGIYIADAYTEEIKNNVIFGGKGSPISYGMIIQNSGCSPVIIDNTIDGGDNQAAGGNSSGILTSSSSSPTIEHNEISISSGNSAWGIEVLSSAAPVITRNLINPGSNAVSSYGIRIENIENIVAEVHNNVILGGGGSSSSYGIYVLDSASNIYNNTVNGGSGGTAYAIWLSMTLTSYSVNLINNNLFNDNKTPSGYAIYESNINSYPNNVTNNNIFNVAVLYYDFDTVSSSITDISTLEATFTPYTGNISENIYSGLDKIYYRYTGDIGLWTFDTGGLVSITTVDRDGLSRTDPCSIGAHEYD